MSSFSALIRPILGGVIRTTSEFFTRLAVIGPKDIRSKRFGKFGRGSSISWPTGAGFGEKWIWIGEDVLIAADVTLSAGMGPGQEMITDPVVRIGDRCLIGRGTSIIGHLAIEIGDDVFTGMNVYITDQNHGYENLDEPIGKQLPNEQPVSIGEGVWIGSGAIILPGSKIGNHVVIGANSVVTGEIPSCSVAVGSPAKVVRLYDGNSWERQGIKDSNSQEDC
jgi:acetyltransferase-like isoleucine patch superfamily enzyme|tara:strand:+ start:86 stop:751 length:666 start_codon:yes stop_codon:yes gene_type:complete